MKTLIRKVVVLLFVMVTGMLSFSFAAVQAEEPDGMQLEEADDTQQEEEERKDLPAPGTVFTTKGGWFLYKFVDGLAVDKTRIGDITYKFTITKSGEDGEGEVELTGFSWKLKQKKYKKYKKAWIVYEEDMAVDESGEEYRITSIGKRAFAKAESVRINSKYIERIGDEAFTGCETVSVGGKGDWNEAKVGGGLVQAEKYIKNLKKIKGKDFSGVKRWLNIYATEIGEIGTKAISGVENVDIYAEKIGQVSAKAISNVKDRVHIKATEIGRISSNACSGVKESVHIYATKIDEIAPKAFSGIREGMDIEVTEIGKIGSNAFSGVRGKLGISFQVEKIGEVGSGVFTNVKIVNFYEGGNDRRIESRLLKSCNKELCLEYKKKKELDAQTMSGVENVREVYVSGDKITKISANAFKNFKKVKRIDILCPKMTRIEDRAFSGCKKVKEIVFVGEKTGAGFIGENKNLTAIGSQIVSGCRELKFFKLGVSKKIRSVKKDAFKGTNAKLCVNGGKSWALRLKGKGAPVYWAPTWLLNVGVHIVGEFPYKKI